MCVQQWPEVEALTCGNVQQKNLLELTQGCRSCAGFCIMVLHPVPEGTENQISAWTSFVSRILYFCLLVRSINGDELRKVRNLVLASA